MFCPWLPITSEFRTGFQQQRTGKFGSQKEIDCNWRKWRRRKFYWKFITSQLPSDWRWIVSRAALFFTATSVQRSHRLSRRQGRCQCHWIFWWRVLIRLWWVRRSGAVVVDQQSPWWKMDSETNWDGNQAQSSHLLLGNNPGQRAPLQWRLRWANLDPQHQHVIISFLFNLSF